ncbi:MAG: DUF4071 domain-containing protein [Planctomycetes bacterium]|nr:DUF4071 domain-containing protein [Planctomycetota bacterium]
MKPLCFVLMPFGRKPGSGGGTIDFDAVYHKLIVPAVERAGLEALRADEERTGGIIHKPMFERLLLCDFAIADLTSANANVYYELGLRHASRPRSTVLIFAEGERLPFDLGPMRGLPYRLGKNGRPVALERTIEALARQLEEGRKAAVDSPLFQLLDGHQPGTISHEKTDVFRDLVAYSKERKQELERARASGDPDELREIESTLGRLEDCETGVLVDLFLSYRGQKCFADMIRLHGLMPEPLKRTVMIREQLALALNRAGHDREAESVLKELIAEAGPSSETYGLLGRIHKDRYDAARKAGRTAAAGAHLEAAIEAYLLGFESDWRDAYPGINACSLMELREPPDPRRAQLLPVVRYAVERRIAAGEPDYWDQATLLELAVLAGDEDAAQAALGRALAALREPFEAETTARNLRLIRETRNARGGAEAWIEPIENELAARGG